MAAPTAAAAASTHTLLASVKRKQIVYKVQQVFVFAAAAAGVLTAFDDGGGGTSYLAESKAKLCDSFNDDVMIVTNKIQNGNDSALHKNSNENNKNGINVVCFYIVIVCPVFWPLTHLRHALGHWGCNGFTRLRLAIFKMGTQFAILLALLL